MVLALLVIGYLLMIGRRDSSVVHANPGVTTEQAAVQAGAKVLPTDPKLKVEPK